MPSHLHEALLFLFRSRPALAPELLREALHLELPAHTHVRLDAAELTDIQPAAYQADLVVLLSNEVPVLGIVVEVQLSRQKRKRFAWPAYVVNLRARLRCPVCLLVVAANERVARWAAKPVDLGGGNRFAPLVLGPSGVPEVTDEAHACADPELAVLSAMAHGRDRDTEKSLRIAMAAQAASVGLDEDRARLYCDLVLSSLGEAARQALQNMNPAKYEYQSEFARRYVAQGRAEGRAELVLRQLTRRFGTLREEVRGRILAASSDELDAIGERLLTAPTLEDALGELHAA
ncbi:MAG TPA: DUF4351 domain-containing protein [Steroidobacteraceae bacterium]|nr:DUF4351 domain-containing protein [Steroidobacteraceae bacterium]